MLRWNLCVDPCPDTIIPVVKYRPEALWQPGLALLPQWIEPVF